MTALLYAEPWEWALVLPIVTAGVGCAIADRHGKHPLIGLMLGLLFVPGLCVLMAICGIRPASGTDEGDVSGWGTR